MNSNFENIESNTVDLTIFVVATKNYKIYARNLVVSVNRFFINTDKVQIIVLTDDPDNADLNIETKSNVEMTICKIESYGWPEATLYRFKFMLDFMHLVKGDVIAYFDADTAIVRNVTIKQFINEIDPIKNSGICLISHPGYFNKSRIFNLLMKSPLGPWENRKLSNARVRYSNRRRYVCGGVFWGTNEAFLRLCNELHSQILIDKSIGIVAKHNDESHLNRWFSDNAEIAGDPKWAFARDYKNLKAIDPIIEVIHKPGDFLRIET